VTTSHGVDLSRGENPAHKCRRPRRETMRHWITSFRLLTKVTNIRGLAEIRKPNLCGAILPGLDWSYRTLQPKAVSGSRPDQVTKGAQRRPLKSRVKYPRRRKHAGHREHQANEPDIQNNYFDHH